MKNIIQIYKLLKSYLKKIATPNKGEISYEEFEKLESKKYPFNPPRCDEAYRRHHLYRCTSECFVDTDKPNLEMENL